MATAALSGGGLWSPGLLAKSREAGSIKSPWVKLSQPWKKSAQFQMRVRRVAAKPAELSEKVAESIKGAEEACAGDPVSGECVAAWDEVEELSAAVSHAKDKKKDSDPLEDYCKDNPETDECRTYD